MVQLEIQYCIHFADKNQPVMNLQRIFDASFFRQLRLSRLT